MKIFLFLLILSLNISLFCQIPDTLWTRVYGGNQSDGTREVVATDDNGYALSGYISSEGNGEHDFWLIKTDHEGHFIWSETYGGEGNDMAYCLKQTPDLGFIIGGQFETETNFSAFTIIKTTPSGEQEWIRHFREDYYGVVSSVVVCPDGGYTLAGWTQNDMHDIDVFVVRTNASGDTLWTKVLDHGSFEGAYSVKQTNDEGFIISGFSNSFSNGNYDLYLLKLDANGNTEWQTVFGGEGIEEGYDVIQTSDDNFLAVGSTDSFNAAGTDLWIIKVDEEGNEVWNHLYGGTYLT